ncbi:MAG: PD-(D/E)XK nuclease family protein, partial [Spirochaetales bacterium]|nr:PD-(D/E)XK nuclease family protein [Spirochaetales bacterium]
ALESQQHAVAIVDYKKNYRGTVGSYMDVGNRNISFQLPMYAKILEEDDRNLEVRLAAYYDTATGTYKVIWNTNEKNSKQELLAELERQLDTMVRRLSEGDFIATPSKENCKNCQYRQICRRRYAFR